MVQLVKFYLTPFPAEANALSFLDTKIALRMLVLRCSSGFCAWITYFHYCTPVVCGPALPLIWWPVRMTLAYTALFMILKVDLLLPPSLALILIVVFLCVSAGAWNWILQRPSSVLQGLPIPYILILSLATKQPILVQEWVNIEFQMHFWESH